MSDQGKKQIKPRNKNPSITCFKSTNDLLQLRDWFYIFDDITDNRKRAIQRVKALSSRGKLPHAVETTSLLVSITLSDPKTVTKDIKQSDSNILKLSYAMAIIRFVNGLLDPFQQSNFAIPLHQLARNLNLPSFFVELRHMGTHEQLPSLDILRIGCNMALNWLFENFWQNVSESYEELYTQEGINEFTEVDSAKIIDIVQKSNVTIDDILSNLKSFKKIRKQNLDIIYKFGNSSEIGIKYWKNIKAIKKHDPMIVMKCLVFKNFMIYNDEKIKSRNENKKVKFNTLLIKLYKPLLDEFGAQFKLELLQLIIQYMNVYYGHEIASKFDIRIDEKLGFGFKMIEEINQIIEWASFLIEDILSFSLGNKFSFDIESGTITSRNDLVHYFLTLSTMINREKRCRLISAINDFIENNPIYSNDIKKLIKNELATLNKQIKLESFAAPPSLDELLGETSAPQKRASNIPSETANKKIKVESTTNITKNKIYLFEKHSDWKPIPFGTSI